MASGAVHYLFSSRHLNQEWMMTVWREPYGQLTIPLSENMLYPVRNLQIFLANSSKIFKLTEPSLALTTMEHLFGCQHNEKPSLQNCSSVVFENCKLYFIFYGLWFKPPLGLNSFSEPCHLVYDVAKPRVDEALAQLKTLFVETEDDQRVARQCREQRIARVRKTDEVVQQVVSFVSLFAWIGLPFHLRWIMFWTSPSRGNYTGGILYMRSGVWGRSFDAMRQYKAPKWSTSLRKLMTITPLLWVFDFWKGDII